MNKITNSDIIMLGKLSMLGTSDHPETIEEVKERLEKLLTYASGLQEVIKTKIVSIMPKNINRLREDQVYNSNAQAILNLAPKKEENYFVVPMILKN